VNFYVESNEEPDFAEDEGIYDELNLEEAEIFGFSNEDEEFGASNLDPFKASPVSPGKKDVDPSLLEKDDDSPKGNPPKEEDVRLNFLTFYSPLLLQILNLMLRLALYLLKRTR
jgi:CCR4-NOT transcription complex subunit 3